MLLGGCSITKTHMLMKKALTFLLVLVFALSGTAQTARQEVPRTLHGAPKSNIKVADLKDSNRSSNPFAEKQKQPKASNKKAAENTVTVTLKFPVLDEEWSMPWLSVHVYNEEGYYEEFDIERWDEEWNELPLDSYDIQLPVGNYDFFTIFDKVDPSNLFRRSHHCYNIVENQNVSEGSVVEFKPWECTVCLTMEPTIPNGEIIRFREIRYLDENWNWEIIEEANIADARLKQTIYFNDLCIQSLSTNAGGVIVEPGPCGYFDARENCNFYVNPVSDKYLFKQLWIMTAYPDVENGVYLAMTQSRGSKAGVYTNSNYILSDQTIAASKSSELYPPMGLWDEPAYPYGIVVMGYSKEDGMDMMGKGIYSQDSHVWKIWASTPANEYEEGELYYAYHRSLTDLSIPIEYDWGTQYLNSGVESAYTIPFTDEGCMTIASPYGRFSAYPQGEKEIITPFPGPEAFAVLQDNIEIEAGASAPLLTFTKTRAFNWETEELIDYIQYGYTGRLDENLAAAMALSSMTLTVDNEEIASDADATATWLVKNPNTKGKFLFNITTDEFKIDGIEGSNRATVIYDTNKDDSTPPAVTMLQIRDVYGNVKQVFKNAADAEIFISAADITINEGTPDEDGWIQTWFTLSEPEFISASCYPTGSNAEDLNDIPLEVLKDTNNGYGFGTVYSGNLKDITLNSETGWYDLTITVEDEAGNIQSQTLSPAFKIESLATGLNGISTDRFSISVTGNEIVAPAGSRIFNVDGIEVSGANVAPGIYIVKTPTYTVKIDVK